MLDCAIKIREMLEDAINGKVILYNGETFYDYTIVTVDVKLNLRINADCVRSVTIEFAFRSLLREYRNFILSRYFKKQWR